MGPVVPLRALWGLWIHVVLFRPLGPIIQVHLSIQCGFDDKIYLQQLFTVLYQTKTECSVPVYTQLSKMVLFVISLCRIRFPYPYPQMVYLSLSTLARSHKLNNWQVCMYYLEIVVKRLQTNSFSRRVVQDKRQYRTLKNLVKVYVDCNKK